MQKSNHLTFAGKTNQMQAQTLLADIEAAPSTALPRREAVVAWLNAFLARSNHKNYVMGETEADDLIALNKFLRTYDVPAASLSTA